MSRPLVSRYTVAKGAEAEFQPGSRNRVLRNKLGITHKREIDQLEFSLLVAAQEAYYDRIEDDTRFTAPLICQMHTDWLGKLFDWAGHYRTVELSKGGFRWPPAMRVPQNMQHLEADVLKRCTPCRGASLPDIAEQLAEVHAELLLVHPFREGNGRLARWLADLMALQAGCPLPEYRLSGKGSVARRRQYLEAVQHGYAQNYQPLTGFFTEALERATV
jgi:cell filamentation protein